MTTSPTTFGFIGLGQMGGPVAACAAAAMPVTVHDLDAEAMGRIAGATPAGSLADVAADCDVVLMCLPSAAACEAVVAGLVAAPDVRTRVVVDLSTVGPEVVIANAATLAAAGITLVDAPVSGGVRAALRGELAVMAAGAADAIDTVRPALETFSAKVVVVGDRPGLAQVMKLANNIIALGVLPLMAEAVALGLRHGLDLAAMVEVINASSGRTQRSEFMYPDFIIPGSFTYGATGEITLKDVSLFLKAAQSAGTPTRIATEVVDHYRRFTASHPQTDYSYLHEFVQEEWRGAGTDGR
jgi:3-hydroxyisobutyrate dehydrogenase